MILIPKFGCPVINRLVIEAVGTLTLLKYPPNCGFDVSGLISGLNTLGDPTNATNSGSLATRDLTTGFFKSIAAQNTS